MSVISLLESAGRPLADYTFRATLLLLVAGAGVRVLEKSSGALRHLSLAAAFAGLLALPLVDLLAPIVRPTRAIPALWPSPHAEVAIAPSPSKLVDLRWNRINTPSPLPPLLPRPSAPILAATLVGIWAAGWLALLAQRFNTLIQAARVIRAGDLPAPGSRVHELLLECVHEARLRVRVDLIFSAQTGLTPATLGWRRPAILLGEVAQSWSDERLRTVFRHEIAHIRRADWIVQQAAWAVCSVLWFHPLAWIAYRALRLEAERAVDDAVLCSGVRPSTYTAELLALVQFMQSPSEYDLSYPMKASIPIAQPSTIEVRIRAILNRTQNRRSLKGQQIALLAPLALSVLIPLSLVHVRAATVASPLPSEQLLAYSTNNLDHLLGPLNGGALPRAELLKLEIDYQGRQPVASPAEKEVLNAAMNVCNAFNKIMDEREKAVASVSGAQATNAEEKGSTKLHAHKGDEFALDQKRREIREGQSQSNFISAAAQHAADSHWSQHEQPWRNSIQQLLVREKQAEAAAAAAATAAEVKSTAPSTPAPAAPAVATEAATTTSAQDPVVGNWTMESGTTITLNADNTITGGRHGTWKYVNTDGRGRRYEFHYNPPKTWVDYLSLSSDGKLLDGHTRNDKAMQVYRQ